ncbi:MAG: PadR family transcriptional regulator [Ktedonobacterales bacterium]
MTKSHPGRDPLILTILAMLAEKPRHPYEIQRLIRERRKDFARSTQRALYHTIDRLVDMALIQPLAVSREGNRPERTVYQLTDEGYDSLMEWLGELIAQPLPDYALFAVAISFLAILPKEVALQCLHARAIELEGELAGIDARLQALSQTLHRAVLLELEYIRALRRGELDWIHTLVEDIRDGQLTWDAEALRKQAAAGDVLSGHAESTLRLIDGREHQSS